MVVKSGAMTPAGLPPWPAARMILPGPARRRAAR